MITTAALGIFCDQWSGPVIGDVSNRRSVKHVCLRPIRNLFAKQHSKKSDECDYWWRRRTHAEKSVDRTH
jgi:hypothetical protein